ncbi:MAG TPA: valine--tRNA ligase [Candidatus Binatia bacterium]|jgi:valyl-tRNA synthetase
MELSKAYTPKSVEEKWYSWWEQQGYFYADVQKDRRAYCITIPPPNVTGELHMGHALQHSIHDVLIRFKRMQGYNTLCLPGTDHAGIATQMKVEQQLWQQEKKSRLDVGRDEMVRRIWEWTEKYGGTILKQLRALGCSYDWRRTRFTLDEGYHKAVLEAFVRFYRRGWIYRGERMVNWCPNCRTVISDLEVEEVATQGFLWYIRYPMQEGDGEVVVATTRPETMLGDTAVAVHPEDRRWQPHIGKQVVLPLMERPIPIVADEYADPKMGSGAVKITPGHDPNDFEVGKRHNLPLVRVIGDDGRMTADAGRFAGLDRFEARKAVLEALEKGGYLVKRDAYQYNIPTHDKCGTIVEPLAKEQWFMNMKPLAESTIPVLERAEVKYFPDRFRNYSIEWLQNIRDWTLSRQLWWGHRIPVWTCRDCNEVIVQAEPPTRCTKCRGAKLEQDPDVLDTWFSSALWPFATLGWPEAAPEMDYFYPTDLLITSREILYLWVSRMITTSLEFVGKIPFRHVLIHPTILTKDGKRMSKSLGTGIDPLELIGMYGADATRFALLYQCSSTQDVRFDADVEENKVLRSMTTEMCRNFANKVWNAARFVLMNLGDGPVAPERLPAREDLELADRWILHRLNDTIERVTEALESYRFDDYGKQLYEFVWSEFCDWYVEMAKLRLYGKDSNEQATVRQMLVFLLDRTLRLIHPAMPFVTEEIWQALHSGQGSIMVQAYPRTEAGRIDPEVEGKMAFLMDIVRAIRNLRAEMNCAPSKELKVILFGREQNLALLRSQERYLRALARVGPVEYLTEGERPKGAATAIVGETEIYVPLGDMINLEEEKTRLNRELSRAQEELTRVQRKLGNNDFVAKAKEEIVRREKEKAEEFEDKIRTLNLSLGRIRELEQAGEKP